MNIIIVEFCLILITEYWCLKMQLIWAASAESISKTAMTAC